jgi:NADPH:quinone reductase-like Zn-dependent oxidoreductase
MAKATVLTQKGGPETLVWKDVPREEPGPGELRVKVRATGVGSTDVTMRRGFYPFAPKMPFVPGYESVGTVDAIGQGVTGFSLGERVCALLVYGGYGEYVVRGAEHWIKVPEGLDDAEVAVLPLNYITAYQMINRVTQVQPGQTALVNAAAGGVGQALVELLKIAGARVIAAASARSHELIRQMGAEPIEGRAKPIDQGALSIVPGGVDCAFDGVGGDQLRASIRATHTGGRVVWYGFMGVSGITGVMRNYFDLYVSARLRGRRGSFYGITALYRKDTTPFRQDLPKLFKLLAERRIHPRIAARLPLSAAREANERLERGGVDGKIVLVA